MSYPAVVTKKDALITENLRSHSLFKWLKGYPSTDLEILIMGPGVKKKEEIDYIPELLEISAVLWDKNVHFTILDHNERVIDAVQNKIYFTEGATVYGLPLTENEKQEYLQYILNASEEISLNKRKFRENEKHKFTTLQCNFSEFQFEKKYDIIVALNSLYYLLNDDKFSSYEEPFLLKLIDSCDVLFIDKISKNLVSYFIGNKHLSTSRFTNNKREIWNILKWMTPFFQLNLDAFFVDITLVDFNS